MTFEINDKAKGARKNITLSSSTAWVDMRNRVAEVFNIYPGSSIVSPLTNKTHSRLISIHMKPMLRCAINSDHVLFPRSWQTGSLRKGPESWVRCSCSTRMQREMEDQV